MTIYICFVKDREHAVARNIKISASSSEVKLFPHLTLKSTAREVISPCFYQVWVA
jgi:hypothetical protein